MENFGKTHIAILVDEDVKKCSINKNKAKRSHTKEEFIEKARKVHGDKYDYSEIVYEKGKSMLKIICPKHGVFYQRGEDHLFGHGCKKCATERNRLKTLLSREKFIEKAKLVHGNRYDYSKVDYNGHGEKICIICPKHGEFWQKANNHLNGSGCPHCNNSIIEKELKQLFDNNNIKYIYNKRFNLLNNLQLDFYLPEYKIGVECQGIQHFEGVEYFGGEKKLIYTQNCDKLKKELCEKNGIKLLYYANYKYDFPYKVFINKEKLLNYIKENGY